MNAITIVGIAVLVLFLILIGPFIPIYAINILLESLNLTEIPYTIGTWFASLLLNLNYSSTTRYVR